MSEEETDFPAEKIARVTQEAAALLWQLGSIAGVAAAMDVVATFLHFEQLAPEELAHFIKYIGDFLRLFG